MADLLTILEGFSPLPLFASAEHVHLLAESMRRAFMDRNKYLGDPEYVELPLARLLLKAHATRLRETIEREHATPTPVGDRELVDGTETTHYSVVDSAGNAVSVTTTLNNSYGSAV